MGKKESEHLVLRLHPEPHDNKMEEIAEKIHQAWSKRNSYSPLAKLTYAQLSEDEKDKDRHQVELARDLIMDQTDIYNLGKGDKQALP